MDTSGSGTVNAALYAVFLVLSIVIGQRLAGPVRRPVATVTLWLLVAIPSVLGLLVPAVYDALHRDPELIAQHGQWWRLVTAVAVQDGGLYGAVFNLVELAVVAWFAERTWGTARTFAIFAICMVTMNLLGVWWNATGGGNSGATFGLAASLAGYALVRRAATPVLLAAGATLVVAVALVALGDGHGVLMLVGAALAVPFAITAGGRVSAAGRPATR